MIRVFADTSYFIALIQDADEAHDKAVHAALATELRIITTEWIVCELANFFSRSDFKRRFSEIIDEMDQTVEVLPATHASYVNGLRLFTRRVDKDWSLTDCISFEIMRQHQINDALTTDHHFEQAGFIALLK